MIPEGSLTCSLGPYPGPDASSPYIPTLFPKIHSNIILPSTPRSSECCLISRFSNEILHLFLIYTMRATCQANQIVLDLITLIILGEAYKL
jgi:hypothetical protein